MLRQAHNTVTNLSFILLQRISHLQSPHVKCKTLQVSNPMDIISVILFLTHIKKYKHKTTRFSIKHRPNHQEAICNKDYGTFLLLPHH